MYHDWKYYLENASLKHDFQKYCLDYWLQFFRYLKFLDSSTIKNLSGTDKFCFIENLPETVKHGQWWNVHQIISKWWFLVLFHATKFGGAFLLLSITHGFEKYTPIPCFLPWSSRPQMDREAFLDVSRVDILCTQLYCICFDVGHWVTVSCLKWVAVQKRLKTTAINNYKNFDENPRIFFASRIKKE